MSCFLEFHYQVSASEWTVKPAFSPVFSSTSPKGRQFVYLTGNVVYESLILRKQISSMSYEDVGGANHINQTATVMGQQH
jgi:hypothetical protein